MIMNISNNIVKHYLKNVYFINGTSYAGKSTMCRMLAEKYDLLLCGENYKLDELLSIVTPDEQPNLSYFHTKKDWQEFLNRAPEEYEKWIFGTSWESASFEVAELIRISAKQKVIVDTNIPCSVLKQIADYNQVAIMLSPQSMSVDYFFEREDEDKRFLLSQIQKADDPEKTMKNFRACVARICSPEHYEECLSSGFYTLIREDVHLDTRAETLERLADHFGFSHRDVRV